MRYGQEYFAGVQMMPSILYYLNSYVVNVFSGGHEDSFRISAEAKITCTFGKRKDGTNQR